MAFAGCLVVWNLFLGMVSLHFWGLPFALATKCGLSEKQPACEHVIPLSLTVRVGMHFALLCPGPTVLHSKSSLQSLVELKIGGLEVESLVLGVWWGVANPFPCPCAWESERILFACGANLWESLGHLVCPALLPNPVHSS